MHGTLTGLSEFHTSETSNALISVLSGQCNKDWTGNGSTTFLSIFTS